MEIVQENIDKEKKCFSSYRKRYRPVQQKRPAVEYYCIVYFTSFIFTYLRFYSFSFSVYTSKGGTRKLSSVHTRFVLYRYQ